MAVIVDISSESRYKFDRDLVRLTVERVVAEHGVTGETEVSVAVVGERKMAKLHKKYLGGEGPTDVMSWPLEGVTYPDDILRLGDVVVCYPVAVRRSGENNRRVDEEISLLVQHGVLHLLGIHHEE